MKAFPGWTADFIRKRLPGAQGWAYHAWAVENEASLFGASLERRGDGYVQQEAKRLAGKK